MAGFYMSMHLMPRRGGNSMRKHSGGGTHKAMHSADPLPEPAAAVVSS